MHSKDQVCHILTLFVNYVSNHFNVKPKFLRYDNGTEIINNHCAYLLSNQGIIHQKSMTHTPQQNGIVERKHRHLLETVRSLHIHANFPQTF